MAEQPRSLRSAIDCSRLVQRKPCEEASEQKYDSPAVCSVRTDGENGLTAPGILGDNPGSAMRAYEHRVGL